MGGSFEGIGKHGGNMETNIVVTINWDAETPASGVLDRASKLLGKKQLQHNLDISCYTYCNPTTQVGCISGYSGLTSNHSNAITHTTKDNTDGQFGENIELIFEGIPKHVKTLVFLVEVMGNHNFSDVQNPHACISTPDGEIVLEIDLKPEKSAYVFAKICRSDVLSDTPDWQSILINEYTEHAKIEDWGTYLSQFV